MQSYELITKSLAHGPSSRPTPVDLSVYFKNDYLRQKRQMASNTNSAHHSNQRYLSLVNQQSKSSVLNILSKEKHLNLSANNTIITHKKSHEQFRLPLIQAVIFSTLEQPKHKYKGIRHISPVNEDIHDIFRRPRRKRKNQSTQKRYDLREFGSESKERLKGNMSVDLERRIESELRLDRKEQENTLKNDLSRLQIFSKDEAMIARMEPAKRKLVQSIQEDKNNTIRWHQDKQIENLRKNRKKMKRKFEKSRALPILKPWQTIDSQHEHIYTPDFQ